MNNYIEFKKEEEKEISLLPIYWAFDKEQLKDVYKKLNIIDDEDFKNKCMNYCGGFILKSDKELINDTLKNLDKKLKFNLDNDDEFLQNAFEYELSNHEYIVTGELSDVLNALGMNCDDLIGRKSDILDKAIVNYKKEMSELGW